MWGESLALAMRLLNEGHQVRMSIADKQAKRVGDGMVEKCELDAGASWADFILFDLNDGRLPDEAEMLRRKHKSVIGSSELAGRLENDRKIGAGIAREAGLRVNVFHEFSGPTAFDKAKAFLDLSAGKTNWVWKSNDSSPDDPPTYVGKDNDLFFRMLVHYEYLYKARKRTPSFILTPKIEGVEVSTEGWFNGRQFFLGNHTVEKNKLADHDLGPKTGCSGCVVWSAENNSLWQKLIPPFVKVLTGKYIGPFDVNAIIDKETNEPTFLEFTPRLGYDAIYAFLELLNGNLGELLSDLAKGKLPACTLENQKRAGTLRLYIPPYPESTGVEGEAQGVPIAGYDMEKYSKHISPCDIMLDDDACPVAAYEGGRLFVLSSIGENIASVYDHLYKQVETLQIPQLGYRTDLAKCIGDEYSALEKTGWLGELNKQPKTFGEIISGKRK
jgi:phosphoribosylamine--glycine ligase